MPGNEGLQGYFSISRRAKGHLHDEAHGQIHWGEVRETPKGRWVGYIVLWVLAGGCSGIVYG